MKKFELQLVYNSGKRYTLDFDVVKEVLQLSEEDIKKIEEAVLLELFK